VIYNYIFFLKLDSFLKDFEITTKNDIKGIDEIDLNPLILRTHEEAERVGDIEKIAENLDDAVAKLEGRNTKGFDAAMDRLLESVENIKPSFESQIKTLEFYKNMGVAMFLYYISDDKIRYFEIFEAFDKLGVFDSYWQKNILNKLDSIETRLTQINNQMNTLNNNFVHLINLSETMVGELKSIDRSIATNNLLLSITAYQTWRINKNTKSIK
jgi:DNA repair ATPase RecN